MTKPLPPVDGELVQAVRVVDVVVLGPVMIFAGNKIGGIAGTFLAASGVATILFNGLNFLEIQKAK